MIEMVITAVLEGIWKSFFIAAAVGCVIGLSVGLLFNLVM